MPNYINKIISPEIPDISTFIQKYPPRNLSSNTKIVRVAPSPTGFAHFGLIFTAIINEHIARLSGGLLLLRIEDTDKNREVKNGIEEIINSVKSFNIKYDEGPDMDGLYGPYIQSERQDIYLSAARKLLELGLAYPCFCTKEELETMRQQQEAQKIRTGYYGKWTKCRNLTDEEINEKLDKGFSYTLRFRTPENPDRIQYTDSIKGHLDLPGNDVDYIIFKSEGSGLGLPVYHLAATVDDHLQCINMVIRGDEWLSSFPFHCQIIKAFDWEIPQYAHLGPILKTENGNKRKLSKRKDPEAAASYYLKEGIPVQSVRAYALRLADSTFENWRGLNPLADLMAFPLSFKNMSGTAGALFDSVKLNDISKNEIAEMNTDEMYSLIEAWTKTYNPEFYKLFTNNPGYSKNMLSIEHTGTKKRKDISRWSEISTLFGYFYDDIYVTLVEQITSELIIRNKEYKNILSAFIENNIHNTENLEKDLWLNKLRKLCVSLGYSDSLKEFKNTPEKFKGHIGDVSMIIRVAITGATMTPDLYEIIKVMGKERIEKRLKIICK